MQLSFYYIAARIVKMMLKLGFLFLGRHSFTHPLPLPIRLRRIVKLKTAIQKFVVSDQSKKFQSVIPAPYQIRGKLRQESMDPSLRWDDSGGWGRALIFWSFFIKSQICQFLRREKRT